MRRRDVGPTEAEIDLHEEAKVAGAADRDGVTVVLPWLLLCGARDLSPSMFAERGVTHHLNCARELSEQHVVSPSREVARLSVDIGYRTATPLAQHALFEQGAQFLLEARTAGGCAVVNCARGRSRSVAVVLFFLLRHHDAQWTLRQAYAHVKRARPMIGPSRHLVPQLLALEAHLRDGRTTLDATTSWSKQLSAAEAPARAKKGKARKDMPVCSAVDDARKAAIGAAFLQAFPAPLPPQHGKPTAEQLDILRAAAAQRKAFVKQWPTEAERQYAAQLF